MIEKLEAALDAINDARAEVSALDAELPAMTTGERLAAERARFRLRGAIRARALGLRPSDGARPRSARPETETETAV